MLPAWEGAVPSSVGWGSWEYFSKDFSDSALRLDYDRSKGSGIGQGMGDVVIVGAGISGITAAQQLQQAGYSVQVVDKSRGLGGRMATRRVGDVAIDHGCRFLQPFTHLEGNWLNDLLHQGILQPWAPDIFDLDAENQLSRRADTTPYYIAPDGMSAIAKTLAQGLAIQRQYPVTHILPVEQGWKVWADTTADSPEPLVAKSLLLAIPAAQIPPLLTQAAQQHPALSPWVAAAEAVAFDPVITVMAGYAPDQPTNLANQPSSTAGWMIFGDDHPALRWVALDSSKRANPTYPVIVLHSSAPFAAEHFEANDLPAIGQKLLTLAAQSIAPWLATPDWVQVHRWRYGLVKQPYPTKLLSTTEVPSLVGCGDWCGGTGVEAAITSGRAAATAIDQWLRMN